MKRIITIFGFILFVYVQCNARVSNHHSNVSLKGTIQIDTFEVINNVCIWYSKINACQDKYNKIVKPLMGRSSEGGELTGYYEKDSLRKIEAIYLGEMGKSITEYYFRNNKLFFIFNTDSLYDKPFYITGHKVNSIEESKYYFLNDTLIRWLDKDKCIVLKGLPERSFKIIQEVNDHLIELEKP